MTRTKNYTLKTNIFYKKKTLNQQTTSATVRCNHFEKRGVMLIR